MIRLSGITKSYQVGNKKILALDNVSLHVPKGVIYGVIGASGAGKSSLLRCVNLLERPDKGEVFVDGKDLMSLSNGALRTARQKIGMIFQHFNLLSSASVFDNIALPLRFAKKSPAQIKETIAPLIKLTGLLGKEDHRPYQLSGGQKQRVAIARALASKPSILLCDEATSALDMKNTGSILQLLRDINEKFGLTILMITHELEVIKSICQQVALLDCGRVVESQSVVDFFSHPQTDMGLKIVQSSLKMQLPLSLESELCPKSSHKKYPVLRIIFRGALVREAIISIASRQFEVDISILQSNIEFIGHHTVGFLLAELRAEELPLKQCLQFFKDKELEYEVVGYVS